MAEPRTNPVLRLMPSLADMAFLLPLVFLFTGLNGVVTMLGDGDTGFHVRAGEWMIAHHRVVTQDIFSYTKAGQPWFAWEWLWDVCFAWIHDHFGLGGVVWVNILLICTVSLLLYKLVLRRTARADASGQPNPIVAIAITGLGTIGASIHWLARPHLVTMLFLVIFMDLLDRVAAGNRGLLWSLPFLTVLWTNLHGGFFIGLILIGAYAGGELIGALVAPKSDAGARTAATAVPYLITLAACFAATFINPYTWHLHQHIIEYFRDPFQTRNIQEFMGTNFQWPSSRFLEVMLVLGVCSAVYYARHKRFTEVLFIVGWGHISLIAVRNVPIFMLAAAVVVAEPVTVWLKALAEAPVAGWLKSVFATILEIGDEVRPMERAWRTHVIPAAVLILLGLGIASPAAGKKLKPEYDVKSYPAAALDELARPGPSTHIFTDDEWGDYLLYHLSPKGIKVFVDGRSDFYGGKFDQEYLDILAVKYNWHELLARYNVDTVLLRADAALAGAMKESNQWRVVYDDTRAIIFRPVQPAVEQVSTSSTGGVGGRGLPVTTAKIVHPEDHEFK